MDLETIDMRAIEIGDGEVRAVVVPALGGGLARFDRRSSSGWRPIMRPFEMPADGAPATSALAMNLLIPWSNRISSGGFDYGGRHHPLAPNLAGEACPIHGDAWLAPWRVETVGDRTITLGHEGEIGPYRYAAQVSYAIEDGALVTRMGAEHRGREPLPYGLGLHPWFVREPGTRLHAPAKAMWLEGKGHLPLERVPLTDARAHDFRTPARLPRNWVNNGFDGWEGTARLIWPDGTGVAIERLETEGNGRFDRFILFSPNAEAPFVCFEPVTHAIDAFHLAGGPLDHGMAELRTGERLDIACRFVATDRQPGEEGA